MGTKIQINSLEALERLIGNDTEIELQMRNAIVSEFTKKHLKQLADSDLMKSTSAAISKELTTCFFDKISGSGTGWRTEDFKFKPEILKVVNSFVAKIFQEQIYFIAAELLKTSEIEQKIKSQLEYSSSIIESSLKEKVLENKLEELVDKRIKEKLGLK